MIYFIYVVVALLPALVMFKSDDQMASLLLGKAGNSSTRAIHRKFWRRRSFTASSLFVAVGVYGLIGSLILMEGREYQFLIALASFIAIIFGVILRARVYISVREELKFRGH